MKQLTNEINENKRKAENLTKLVAVQLCIEGLGQVSDKVTILADTLTSLT